MCTPVTNVKRQQEVGVEMKDVFGARVLEHT
jgi:hypothetical protein